MPECKALSSKTPPWSLDNIKMGSNMHDMLKSTFKAAFVTVYF